MLSASDNTPSATTNVPATIHDCTGPLTLFSGLHLAASSANVVFQETVRAHIRSFYDKLVDTLPVWEVLFVRSTAITLSCLAIGRTKLLARAAATPLRRPLLVRGAITLAASYANAAAQVLGYTVNPINTFTDVDGHRYQVFVTDLEDADIAYLEALYRARGRADPAAVTDRKSVV